MKHINNFNNFNLNEGLTNADYRKLKRRFNEVDMSNNYDEDDEFEGDYREFIISSYPISIVIGIDEGYDDNAVLIINGETVFEMSLDDNFDIDSFLIEVENILYEKPEYFELYKNAMSKKYFNIDLNNIRKYNKHKKAKNFNL